jgi:hypothetical protein
VADVTEGAGVLDAVADEVADPFVGPSAAAAGLGPPLLAPAVNSAPATTTIRTPATAAVGHRYGRQRLRDCLDTRATIGPMCTRVNVRRRASG